MSLYTRKKKEIDSIVSSIELQLRNRESFGHASVMDRGSIVTLCGFLTVVPSYIFVDIDLNEEDLKNPNDVIDRFVAKWCRKDNTDEVRRFQQFISDGMRFGWD